MTNEQKYTADEMREAAKSMTYGDDESSMEFVMAEVGDNLTLKESVDETNTVASMLRYAAGVVERCEESQRKIWKHNKVFREIWGHDDSVDGNKLINYILRGDAGKEER